MAKQNKKVDQIRQLYHLADSSTRRQWQQINQKGYEFAHDEQLAANEKNSLEEQGMPTFTINRILPVVEMLNFYATANNPRWQAVGVEGSDTDVAAVQPKWLQYYDNSNRPDDCPNLGTKTTTNTYGGTGLAKRHTWYVGISASPLSIGSKTSYGLYVSLEYL